MDALKQNSMDNTEISDVHDDEITGDEEEYFDDSTNFEHFSEGDIVEEEEEEQEEDEDDQYFYVGGLEVEGEGNVYTESSEESWSDSSD